jgi:hypothetical protein
MTRYGGWEEAVASKKRESKSDRKRTKLEKRRRKLEKKLREVEERLKKNPKPSKTATGSAHKAKQRAKSGAARSAPKRPVQKVKPATKKIARKAKKPKPAANSGSKSAGRPKRARRAPSATGLTGTQEPTARYSQTLPAAVLPASNTAPG